MFVQNQPVTEVSSLNNNSKTKEILLKETAKITPLALWLGLDQKILSLQDPVEKWQILDGYILLNLKLKIAAHHRQSKMATQKMITNMIEKVWHTNNYEKSINPEVWIRIFELGDDIWFGDQQITAEAMAYYTFYLNLIKGVSTNEQAYELLDQYY
jgi:hypothetical protein